MAKKQLKIKTQIKAGTDGDGTIDPNGRPYSG